MESYKKNGSSTNETKATVSYFNLLKTNLGLVLTISLVVFSISLIYAITASDIYVTKTVLKVSEPQGKSVLGNSPIELAMGSSSSDRYIANEIEVMLNRTIREEVGRVVLDSVKKMNNTDNFELVYYVDNNIFSDDDRSLRSNKGVASQLLRNVEIKQKGGLDFIEITVESQSPNEAALVANCYAQVYKEFNLADSRKLITQMKEFLADQRDAKFNELVVAEDNLKVYQIQGGGVELGQQALNLIQTTSQFEAEKNRVQIEMSMARESLTQLQQELRRRDISVSDYMASQSAQPEITMLREEIAKEQIQKTKALAAAGGNINTSDLIAKYDSKIANLNQKLNELLENSRAKILASSPEDLKQLNGEIFQAELKYSID